MKALPKNLKRIVLSLCWSVVLACLVSSVSAQGSRSNENHNNERHEWGDHDKDDRGDREKGNRDHDRKKGDREKSDHEKGNHDACDHEKENDKGDHEADCGGNGYSTSIEAEESESENGCVDYTLTVSHDGTSRYGLSHFSVSIPCGEVSNVSNSENRVIEFGKDPTTGLRGFKIDNIEDFGGRQDPQSFTVSFTLCNQMCDMDELVVAYKAGRCVDYDSLDLPSDPGEDPDGEDPGGEDPGGEDPGGEDPGGEDPGGEDPTCSTLTATLEKTNPACFGSPDGQLSVVITDGTEPFAYRWSNGATTAAITNLSAGHYSVTVVDAQGNVLTLDEELVSPTALEVSEVVVNPLCMGMASGSIALAVSGGTAPYSYSWSNGSTARDLDNVMAGFYSVTITDASGCQLQRSYSLTYTSSLTLSAQVTHDNCNGNQGAINIVPSGGTLPYTYLWSTGATTEDVSGLPAGRYTVVLTDASGCSRQTGFTILDLSTIRITSSVTPTNCVDDASGAIDLTVTGGTAPYTIQWEDGTATEDRSGLVAGTYVVSVTDAAGCKSSSTLRVAKKTLFVTSQVTQPRCSSETGSITVIASGGTEPYTYTWSNGETGETVTGLSPGSYSVTVTDGSGCTITLFYPIALPPAMNASARVSNAECGAEGAFAIDLTVSGGFGPYTYNWSNQATTQDLSGLNSGTYSVVVTDSKGCTASTEVVVEPATASWSCLINPPAAELVCGSAGNLLTASVTDADGYQWDVSSSDNSWSVTSGATAATVVYTAGTGGSSAVFSLVIVKDGCSRTCTYEVAAGTCAEKDNTGGGDPANGDPCEEEVPSEGAAFADGATYEENLATDPIPYPNPFDDKVNIRVQPDADDYIQIDIMDGTGRRLSTLYSGYVKAGESYTLEWRPPTDQTQIYFYRCTSSKGRMVTGKLLRN